MNSIALYNRKGGVGKSACAASIGGFLARAGHKVLLVDLDSQANLTSTYLSSRPEKDVTEVFASSRLPIVPVTLLLHLTPASLDLAATDYSLGKRHDRYTILRDVIAEQASDYDFVIYDLPPAMNHIATSAVAACQYLLSPILPDIDSIHGLQMVEQVCGYAGKESGIDGIVINMFNVRRTIDRQVDEKVRDHYGDALFMTKIHQCNKLRECRLYRTDIATYAPSSTGGQDFLQLTRELLTRI